jgi:hypothetical protein
MHEAASLIACLAYGASASGMDTSNQFPFDHPKR